MEGDYRLRVQEKTLLFELLSIKKEADERGITLPSLSTFINRHETITDAADIAHVKNIFST